MPPRPRLIASSCGCETPSCAVDRADREDLFTGGAGSSSGQEPAPMSRLRYELEPKDLLPVFAQPAANADEELVSGPLPA